MTPSDPPAGDELLAVLRRRGALLATLDGVRRSTAADRAAVSESTVDRGVRELVEADLITRSGERYRRTLAGDLLLAERARAAEVLSRAATDAALDVFRDDAPLDPSILVGAETFRSDGPGPDPVERFVDEIEDADDLRLYAAFVVDDAVERYRRRIVDEGLSVDVVVAEDGLERLVSRHRPPMQEFVTTDRLTMRTAPATVPFSLKVADPEDPDRARASVLAVEDGRSAYVGTDDDEAVAWALDTFADIWAAAEPLPAAANSTSQ